MSFRIGVDCIFSLRCHRTQPHGTQELGAEGRATKSRSPCVCFSATGTEVVCKREGQGCRLVKGARHSHSLQRFARVLLSAHAGWDTTKTWKDLRPYTLVERLAAVRVVALPDRQDQLKKADHRRVALVRWFYRRVSLGYSSQQEGVVSTGDRPR